MRHRLDTDLLVAGVAGLGGFLFMVVSYKDITPDARFISGAVLLAAWLIVWCVKAPLNKL